LKACTWAYCAASTDHELSPSSNPPSANPSALGSSTSSSPTSNSPALSSPAINSLEELLKAQPALWRGRDQYNDYASIPTGYAQLDKALPSGGWGVGCLTELLLEQHGIGELSLLLPGLQQVTSGNASDSRGGQWAAFVNPPYLPYAPALANAGINLERLLIINTDNDNDTLWATEQLLRTGLFASVVGWVSRTTAQKQRRLQLAAELGKTWATIYRPASAQDQHSPAALRIVVSAVICNTQSNNVHSIGNKTVHNPTRSSASHHMNLDIIKSRGGKQHNVQINPNQFDHSQGVEWPAMPQDINSTPNLQCDCQCDEQCNKQCSGCCSGCCSGKINPVIQTF